MVNEKIIEARVTYEFNSWHWSLVAQNEVLEIVKIDVDRIKEQIGAIQDKIFLIVVEILGKETIQERDMQLENLNVRKQDIFFSMTGPVLKSNLDKASNLLSIRDAFHKQEVD